MVVTKKVNMVHLSFCRSAHDPNNDIRADSSKWLLVVEIYHERTMRPEWGFFGTDSWTIMELEQLLAMDIYSMNGCGLSIFHYK